MRRSLPRRAVLLPALMVCAISVRSADQSTGVREAAEALQRGDFPTAEQKLRAEARAHPDNAWALSLLGYTLDGQKRSAEADEFHRRAMALSHSTEILNNFGTHLWSLGQYAKAEEVLSQALADAPTYFNVLYNLGMISNLTGHYERAREVLEAALRQKPENADVLYRLACAEEGLKRWEPAAAHLAHAARIAPDRVDVQKLLAVTATELGALADAAAAWDRYLKLEPADDTARRERGYTAVKMGKLEQGIADIEWYVARHEDDAAGHYELGQAQRNSDVTQAILHLDKALELNPNHIPARAARGSLYYQIGKPEQAVKDLELAAEMEPDNAGALDRLGLTYQALDRASDAVRVLRRAFELAPGNSKVLLHLGRALADAGQTEESKVVLDAFRKLGPEKNQSVPEGLVGYLGLTPELRRKDYRARVEKAIRDKPDDAAAVVSWLKLLLEQRDTLQAARTAKRIVELKPGAAVLADAGRALLEANSPALAKELLQQASASGPAAPDVLLDLARATFRVGALPTRAKAALEVMDRIPESGRNVDYYLVRAHVLQAAGRPQEESIEQALRMTGEAARALPDRREILLAHATTLEFARRTDEALTLVKQLQARWPEWGAGWAAQGIILAIHQRHAEAQRPLEAADALGAAGAEVSFFLAKTYDALGRQPEAGKQRDRLRSLAAVPADAVESWYLDRFLEGGLLKP